jgi:integrase/recombinase XerD
VRDLALNTQRLHVEQVSWFARHFNRSPELLGPEEIRAYQVYLTDQKKLKPSAAVNAVAALSFVYKVTLNKDMAL